MAAASKQSSSVSVLANHRLCACLAFAVTALFCIVAFPYMAPQGLLVGRSDIECNRQSVSVGHLQDFQESHETESSNRSFSAAIRAEKCKGKRVFMYDLPPKFNTGLIEQCNGSIISWIHFCLYARNDGLGQHVRRWPGWYATDLYMMELVFHRRMQRYSCLVETPDAADVYYIPYYSGLDALHYFYGTEAKRKSEHGRELVTWLTTHAQPWLTLRGGADHFMVTGRTVWDLHPTPSGNGSVRESAWGTSLLDLPELREVVVLTVEGRTWDPREQAVPYVTSFHPVMRAEVDKWVASMLAAKRNFLYSFAGAERPGLRIREAIIRECRASERCQLVDCGALKCTHEPTVVMDGLLRSEFCLQPPGDTPTRRSTFDGLIAGCIPVFFRNDSAYEQYTWHLPADRDSYSVFIPEADVVEGRVAIGSVLEGFSRKRIRQMRETIVSIIPRIVYRKNGFGSSDFEDAFDLSVQGMLRALANVG